MTYDDGLTRLLQGDALDVLAALPEKSVDCVVTSPPYWGLRLYSGEQERVWGNQECLHEWGEAVISQAKDSNRGDMEWTTGENPAAKILGERCPKANSVNAAGRGVATLGRNPVLRFLSLT